MIDKLEIIFRRLRRVFSRSSWLARFMGLPVSHGQKNRPGLLMIQIDGLSRFELEEGLRSGRLPFLKRLLRREHYCTRDLYTGLPSGTPGFQGELFYGVKTAVPAFSFVGKLSHNAVSMFEPDVAAHTESILEKTGGEALLKEGSVYGAFYTGGATWSHYCPSSIGWKNRPGKWILPFSVFLHLFSLVRIGVLLFWEILIAVFEFLRGIISVRDFAANIRFVPFLVAGTTLMRELSVIGVKMDLARGLPTIFVNIVTYDERSHRQGPDSAFARRTLKGIDRAAKKLWRAAQRSPWRRYETWIFSDHGQARCRPYHLQQGTSLEKSVSDVFKRLKVKFKVGAHGPVGFIYPEKKMDKRQRDTVAQALVLEKGIPLVLVPDGNTRLKAFTRAGEYVLPRDIAAVFGADHPHLKSLGPDLRTLCRHPDAGELTLLGWCEGATPVSFADEFGCHGGASPGETGAFCLLPADTALPVTRHALRAGDLRKAALHHLERESLTVKNGRYRPAVAGKRVLRVMTYNVHGCIGMDGMVSPERIARVIARCNPDVVALQEIDVRRERSGNIDQAHMIALYLRMKFHFHPAIHLKEEKYGDAILSRLPMKLVKTGGFPQSAERPHGEPRGALWVSVKAGGREIQLLNTHLGVWPSERRVQTRALHRQEWLGDALARAPMIFCGDLNVVPGAPVWRDIVGRGLIDVQSQVDGQPPRQTYFTSFPMARIDHIFVTPGLKVLSVEVPTSTMARVSSDHLPLIAEIAI